MVWEWHCISLAPYLTYQTLNRKEIKWYYHIRFNVSPIPFPTINLQKLSLYPPFFPSKQERFASQITLRFKFRPWAAARCSLWLRLLPMTIATIAGWSLKTRCLIICLYLTPLCIQFLFSLMGFCFFFFFFPFFLLFWSSFSCFQFILLNIPMGLFDFDWLSFIHGITVLCSVWAWIGILKSYFGVFRLYYVPEFGRLLDSLFLF